MPTRPARPARARRIREAHARVPTTSVDTVTNTANSMQAIATINMLDTITLFQTLTARMPKMEERTTRQRTITSKPEAVIKTHQQTTRLPRASTRIPECPAPSLSFQTKMLPATGSTGESVRIQIGPNHMHQTFRNLLTQKSRNVDKLNLIMILPTELTIAVIQIKGCFRTTLSSRIQISRRFLRTHHSSRSPPPSARNSIMKTSTCRPSKSPQE